MRLRFLMSAFLASVLIASQFAGQARAAGGGADSPVVVLQVKSPESLLACLTTAAKNFLPNSEYQSFERDLLSKIDLKNFKGIDPKKPFGFYATLGDGIQRGDFSKSMVVALVPVSDEKALLDVIGGFGMRPEKNGDEYTLPVPLVSASMRFSKGYALICVGMGKLDTTALLGPDAVFNNKETAAAVLRVRMERVPEELRKQFVLKFNEKMGQMFEMTKMKRGPGVGPITPEFIQAETEFRTMQWLTRWTNLLVNDGKEMIFRLDLDPKTGVLSSEMALEARSNSALAKSVRQIPQTRNDFTGIIGADSAASLLVEAPLFIDDFKDLLFQITQWMNKPLEGLQPKDLPRELGEAITEGSKAFGRAVQEGHLDFAASLRGPDKDNHFTAVGAVTLKETSDLDKALRSMVMSMVKTGRKELSAAVKLDAFNVKGVAVHQVTLSGTPPDVLKVFGKSPLYVSLHPRAAIVTYGSQGKEIITEILAAPPVSKATPLLQADISPKRVSSLFKTLGAPPAVFEFIDKLTTSERSTVLSLKVEGGEKLTVRADLGLPALLVLAPRAAVKRSAEGK